MSQPANTLTDWPPITELELAKLAAAINPRACQQKPEVAINQALQLLMACKHFLGPGRTYAQRLTSRFREHSLVILTKESDDSARAWLRQHAANAEDRISDPVNLLNALNRAGIELAPADSEAVAFDRFSWAVSETVFRERFSEPTAWPQYWQEHVSDPKIYPVYSGQLEELLKFRRSGRAQKQKKTRLTKKGRERAR